MTGREFVTALDTRGYVVLRRSSSFVWMGRGDETLMVDLDSTIPDGLLATLHATKISHAPPRGGRRSRPISSSPLGRSPRTTPKA